MGKAFGIINLISVLFFSALLIGYMNYISKERDEIERLKLSYAIDYASDAAAINMLKTADLDMDYTKEKYFQVDPTLALDTFLDVFCLNYDLFPTLSNKAYVQEYIPVAAVTGYDGYYIASQQVIRTSSGDYPEGKAKDLEWGLVFEMKRPYSYEHNGVNYALNMGFRNTVALKDYQMVRLEGLPLTDNGRMSTRDAKDLINTTVSNEMAHRINLINDANPNWRHNFFIPNQIATFNSVNPIEGPSFLVLVQNLKMNTTRAISGFSVSGTSVEMRRMVVGYVRDGVNYYTFADRVPAGVTVDELFYTINEAASNKYYPDLETLKSKPKPKGG
ncbi:hypothetical protein [Paenibacillus sp. L3-i20]|uniref:hypothetical protein n=1 Tax=Paenibacillus sp. L3-i20 TaxID=2905833 RepID=UPI001EDDE3AA|nr:hypothetical protein [Paenibacillus sp. L3-i20]GKU77576.1 hypothetical protein L3i20_v219730 [Paenibacillus sp. L3-i20]